MPLALRLAMPNALFRSSSGTVRHGCNAIGRVLPVALICASAVTGTLLVSRAADAQVYVYYSQPPPPPPPRPYYYEEPRYAFNLGIDVEGVAPLNPPNGPNGQTAIGGGGGLKLRAGEQIRFPGLRFTPEVGYAYDHLWASDNLGDGYDWSINRLFAGARLGFGRVLVPTIYAHLGYGWRQTDAAYATGDNGGLAFDLGGALDLHVVPHLGFGLHLEYSQLVLSSDTPQWIAIGGHMDIAF